MHPKLDAMKKENKERAIDECKKKRDLRLLVDPNTIANTDMA